MADPQLLDKIHSLSDLELAALLCLIAREHCLISTDPDSVDELADELRLVASKTFGLTSSVVSCHAHTTLDDFANGLFVSPPRPASSPANTRSVSPYRSRHEQQQQQSQLSAGQTSSSGSYFSMNQPGRISGPISPISTSLGGGRSSSQVSQPRIANVVLAKDLDRAPRAVQIQALELLRTRRIFTRTSIQTAPKQFLFIALVGAASAGEARVTPHLNDFLYLSHRHDPEEHGFPYLDEELDLQTADDEDNYDDDGASPDESASAASRSSVVKSKHYSSQGTPALGPARHESNPSITTANNNNHNPTINPQPLLTESDLSNLSLLSRQTHTSIPVLRYQANLVAFLRAHRAVCPATTGTGTGATPTAARHLEQLCRSLAALHGLSFVTPSLVALVLPKVFAHRLNVMKPEEVGRERSVQWGSDPAMVRERVLEGIGAEEVVEEVLGMVKVPC
ncbi:hypothetical protein VTJ49DRAFT_4482 [Mycothermus thermophilus]|uniref:magnesium chelatase n=1 Tax=Humicola insolens TaxID=85995 RepID=A0ABR3VNG5_HUMIN